MTAMTSAHEPQWLALCPGQAGLHWLTVGTTLVTLEGSLRLEPPSRSVAAAGTPRRWPRARYGNVRVVASARRWAHRRAPAHRRRCCPHTTPDVVSDVALAGKHHSAAPDLARLK